MTTIIVIVVVALVFFVTICVVSLMIWKRETEMRTDSLKAIEQNLEDMLSELSDSRQFQKRVGRQNVYEPDKEEILRQVADRSAAGTLRGTGRRRSTDPFAWVKTQRTSDKNLKTEQELSEKSVFKKTAETPEEEKLPKELRWTAVMETEEIREDRQVEEPVEQPAEILSAEMHADEKQPELQAAAEQCSENAEKHDDVDAEKDSSEKAEEKLENELCEIDEIVLPDISDFGKKEPEILSLDESFRDIENLIKNLTEEVAERGIDLDIIVEEEPEEDPEDQYMGKISVEAEEMPAVRHMGYDTGRSGRKYTAEELEALIKE